MDLKNISYISATSRLLHNHYIYIVTQRVSAEATRDDLNDACREDCVILVSGK